MPSTYIISIIKTIKKIDDNEIISELKKIFVTKSLDIVINISCLTPGNALTRKLGECVSLIILNNNIIINTYIINIRRAELFDSLDSTIGIAFRVRNQ